MKTDKLTEKQLQEILELAKIAEQKMRESSEGLAALANKCRRWYQNENTKL